MKYIKELNINFDDWDEVNNDIIDINKFLLSAFESLEIGDKVLVDFTRNGNDYNKEWGTIKYKNNNVLCIEFENNIQGHDGFSAGCRGKSGHCWYFKNNSNESYNLFIMKIKK